MARLVSTLGVIVLLVAVSIATVCLNWLGDWKEHEFGLTLTLRILWGVWLVVLTALILTRVTIFGWSFRNYLRLDVAGPPLPRRPATAPWYKSGIASFSITVYIVASFAVAFLTTAVMWILEDVTGKWVFWLVSMIVWVSWWVLFIAAILTRLYLFAKQKYNPANKPPTTQAPTQQQQTPKAKT
jgi:hypothetical protein